MRRLATAARPHASPAQTSTSTVGLPRESRILACVNACYLHVSLRVRGRLCISGFPTPPAGRCFRCG
jgi:hypothetical protein